MNAKVIVIAVILLAVLGGGYLFLNGSKVGNNLYSTSSPSTTASTNPSTVPQGKNVVTLTPDGWSPSTLVIKAGETVTWVNKSGAEGAVYSVPHPIHTAYPPLNLGTFPDGGTLSLEFDKAGSYGYHNHLNPSQTGVIVVQ